MIDKFDYMEPRCSLCEGKEFYNPQLKKANGRIDVSRIINRVDECFNKNDMLEAKRLLEFWQNEAKNLNDQNGELSIDSELIGLYRKINEKENALKVIDRALFLIDELKLNGTISSATIILNCATTLKAFNNPNKAITLYDKTFEIYSKNLKENDPLYGGFYNNMALTLVDLGEYDKAEKCYKNAIDVMSKTENGQADMAISYVNMAHMFEDAKKDKKQITDCLFSAYELLNTESLPHNGYYAYVLSKCYPSFAYFGYDKIANELKELSEEIYARN